MEEIRITEGLNYIHLFSGGLDSTYALLKLAKEIDKGKKGKGIIQPIFMDYGQFAAKTEWEKARLITSFITKRLREPNLIPKPIRINLRSDLFNWCNNQAFTGKNLEENECEIPNRNMVLLSVVFSYLMACAQNQGIERAKFEISSGFKDGEMKDCSSAFFDSVIETFKIYNQAYSFNIVLLPSVSLAKIFSDLKRLVHGKQSDFNQLLSITSSCYAPIDGKPCGSCYKCRTRAQEKRG